MNRREQIIKNSPANVASDKIKDKLKSYLSDFGLTFDHEYKRDTNISNAPTGMTITLHRNNKHIGEVHIFLPPYNDVIFVSNNKAYDSYNLDKILSHKKNFCDSDDFPDIRDFIHEVCSEALKVIKDQPKRPVKGVAIASRTPDV